MQFFFGLPGIRDPSNVKSRLLKLQATSSVDISHSEEQNGAVSGVTCGSGCKVIEGSKGEKLIIKIRGAENFQILPQQF